MPRIIVDESVCKGCEMCVIACPKKIIALAKEKINAKGYYFLSVTPALRGPLRVRAFVRVR